MNWVIILIMAFNNISLESGSWGLVAWNVVVNKAKEPLCFSEYELLPGL